MGSPATVVSPDTRVQTTSKEPPGTAAALSALSIRKRLSQWLLGWKQTLIAELASLGSPKEGFR